MKNLGYRPLVGGLMFGEGPRWRNGRLYVSDTLAGRVVSITPEGSVEEVVQVAAPSGLGWLPDGRMLVASMVTRCIHVLKDGELSVWSDLTDVCLGQPNDMVVDSRGRVYLGNTGADLFKGEPLAAAELLLIEDGRPSVVVPRPEVEFGNGMVITPDGGTLIIAETIANRLSAFTIDQDSGALSNRRVFADLGDYNPDGICLDAENGVWFGAFAAGKFCRVVEGGEITHIVDVGDRRAVACASGGEGRKTLFILSADTIHEKLIQGISTARVDMVDLPFPGAGSP